MKVLLFCALLKCVFGVIFPISTSEGISSIEERPDDVIAYFQNEGATTVTEDNGPGESPWNTQTGSVTEVNDMDIINPDYDVDFINNAMETSNKNLIMPSETWSSLSDEENEMIKDIGNSTAEETLEITENQPEDSPDINPTPKKKLRRKFSSRKGIEDKPRKQGRRMKNKFRTPQLKGNWKKTCCSFGKKIGNAESTYLAENLFEECGEKTRNLSSSKITRQCKMIFMSCCENRALRRFYAEHKLNSTLQN